DVLAALSGTVSEVKEDPLLGNVVVLTHDNGVTTYYASLGEVGVKAQDEVKQGDVIGTAGENIFGQNNGVHVHFEIRKDEKVFNPEEFFNQPVSKLESTESEDVSEEDTSSINSEEVDSNEATENTEEGETSETETDEPKEDEESKDDSTEESTDDSTEEENSTDSEE